MEIALRSDMKVMEIGLRSDMQVGFATLRGKFIGASNRQIKWMVTFAAAWSSLLVAAVRLIP